MNPSQNEGSHPPNTPRPPSHMSVKLGVRTEMSGPKSCEALAFLNFSVYFDCFLDPVYGLASTCRLRRSLAGCLDGVGESGAEPRRSLRRQERVKEK